MGEYKFGALNKKSDIQIAIEELYALFDKKPSGIQVKAYENYLFENRITLPMFKTFVTYWVNNKEKWPQKSDLRKHVRSAYASYYAEVESIENKDLPDMQKECRYKMCLKGCKGWIYVKPKEMNVRPALVKRCKCINEKAFEDMLKNYIYVPEHEAM